MKKFTDVVYLLHPISIRETIDALIPMRKGGIYQCGGCGPDLFYKLREVYFCYKMMHGDFIPIDSDIVIPYCNTCSGSVSYTIYFSVVEIMESRELLESLFNLYQ